MSINNKDEDGSIPYEIIEAARKVEIYAEKNGWGKNWKLLGIQARQNDDEKNMKYANESKGSYIPPSNVFPPPNLLKTKEYKLFLDPKNVELYLNNFNILGE